MSSLTPEQRAQIRALLDADEQGVPVTEWDYRSQKPNFTGLDISPDWRQMIGYHSYQTMLHLAVDYHPDVEFRRRPRTGVMNGIEYPLGAPPEYVPKEGEWYAYPSLCHSDMYYITWWSGSKDDQWRLRVGICHFEAQGYIEGAQQHARAMIGMREGE